MQLRHEAKCEINYCDMTILKSRLQTVMKNDPSAPEGKYKVRSLYFDNIKDKALRERLYGIGNREKFRVRYYNEDINGIHLEKKSKFSGLGEKHIESLSSEEVKLLLEGNYGWIKEEQERPLLWELYRKILSQGLRPKTIVDYTREAFVFEAGNVRVTLDYDIRTGLSGLDFLNPNCTMMPINEKNTILLEIKWDHFLPDIIRDIVQLNNRQCVSFSKYATSRIYD